LPAATNSIAPTAEIAASRVRMPGNSINPIPSIQFHQSINPITRLLNYPITRFRIARAD
jgi:hypothetical protein